MKNLAFLRRLNVGSHNLKMEQLREIFSELGFDNVRTYIQSGNVAFKTEAKPDKLEAMIEAKLKAELGYEVPTYVRTVDELRATIEAAPFFDDPPADVRQLINFTKSTQIPAEPFPISSPKGDSAIVGRHDREVYIRWQIINGRPPDTNKFFKDFFGSPAAAGSGRFYHTLKKLLVWAES